MTHDNLLPRRRPRWSELRRPLLQLSVPKLSRQAAVKRAASIDDPKAMARPRSQSSSPPSSVPPSSRPPRPVMPSG
jgi:hypothetical protein